MGGPSAHALWNVLLSGLIHWSQFLRAVLPISALTRYSVRNRKRAFVWPYSSACLTSLTLRRFYPSTSTISEWFNKKRALALGIAVSGSSIGGVIWPMVLTKLFDAVNGPWTHRLVALISVPFLLVSCSLVKERKGVAGHNTAGHENKVPQSSHIKAILQWRFGFLCLSLLFIYCGMLVPFHYIPVYAEDCGISTEMANNLLAIGYVGSFFGRIGSGWAADCIGR